MAKEIEELTNGRVKFTIYGGGALGPMQEQYNLALSGTADVSSVDPGANPGVFPRTDVAQLPVSWKSNEIATIIFWELVQKYMQDTELKDVKVLWVMTSGLHQLQAKTKPLNTLEDFQGMKLGVHTPMLREMAEALGAIPVLIMVGEMYTALERGLVDGSIFNLEGAFFLRYLEVTKYRTMNVNISTSAHAQMMNLDVWHSLPPDIQKIFDEGGAEWSRRAGASWEKAEPPLIQQIEEYDKRAGNPPFYHLPESEKARWKEAVQPVIDVWIEEVEAEGIPGRAMLEDLRALHEKY